MTLFNKYLTKTGRLSSKQPQNIRNQWFISKAQSAHSNFFDYSLVTYRGSLEKVSIICPQHGIFEQRANSHLEGAGCPNCSKRRKKTTEEYLQLFSKVHNNKYDYQGISHIPDSKVALPIKCPVHGVFHQSANTHQQGHGCQKCQGVHKKTTQEQITDFITVHGAQYDYEQVNYINSYTNVDVKCKIHGKFSISPTNHLTGTGCPKCTYKAPDILYLFKCTKSNLIKIGITTNVAKRLKQVGPTMVLIKDFPLHDARYYERELHCRYQEYRQANPLQCSGITEFFRLSEPQLEELICFLSQHQDQ